jgi:hypothetical protein
MIRGTVIDVVIDVVVEVVVDLGRDVRIGVSLAPHKKLHQDRAQAEN